MSAQPYTVKEILYFDKDQLGTQHQNFSNLVTLRKCFERAQQLNITHLVIGTASGRSIFDALQVQAETGYAMQIVAAVDFSGIHQPGISTMNSSDRVKLEEQGVRIIQGSNPLQGIESSFRQKFGGISLNEVVLQTLALFGQGMTSVVTDAVMAADAGLIPIDEDVIITAEKDTAVVLRAASENRFFDLRIKEIIAMPS